MFLHESLRRQPPWRVWLVALALVGLIGWFDYATDWEWSFFAPYAAPIALVAWTSGRRLGFALATLCAATFCVAHIGQNPYPGGWGLALAVAGWWFYFAVLAVAVAAVKAHGELDRARIATLERAQELEREILEIADREKERLGRELHDGLCQTLAGIAALSSTHSRRLAASSDAAASAAAADVTRLLHEAISEARDLARGLSPMGLDEAGLDGALATLAVNLQNLFRVACTLECSRPFARLRREAEMHLFRIAQEAVNNAVAHGRAERIEISLSSTEGEGRLTVRDNGVGLPEASRQRDGIGLRTMAYRANLIGGSLEVRRRTPRGTAVRCVFPLP